MPLHQAPFLWIYRVSLCAGGRAAGRGAAARAIQPRRHRHHDQVPIPTRAASQHALECTHPLEAQTDCSYERSRDFYEGMRPADPADVAAIAELLAPLEAEGILAPRSRAQLEADLPHFVVAEREAKVGITVCAQMHSARRLACALLARKLAPCHIGGVISIPILLKMY